MQSFNHTNFPNPNRTKSPKRAEPQPVWDFRNGPDHSSIHVNVPARHTREDTPADYAPARDIPIPPNKSSGRSTCYYLDPTDGLYKVAESQLEGNATLRFIADRHVVRIEPQFGPVHYETEDGRRTHTVFDHRITFDDAKKGVVSVKVAARAAKLGTDALNRLILAQMPETEADFVQLVSERDLPQWALANFRLIQSVRNDGHWRCEAELRAAAARLRNPISIEDFARPWGGARTVFRTVVFLLFDGTLRQVEPGELDETALVVGAKAEESTHEVQ